MIYSPIICYSIESTYICNVFFIVLDFKVNKGWSTAVLLFYLYILKAQILLNIQSNRSASYSQNGKTVFE